MSELHYAKAHLLYATLESPCEMLRVDLEKAAMLEHHLAGARRICKTLL